MLIPIALEASSRIRNVWPDFSSEVIYFDSCRECSSIEGENNVFGFDHCVIFAEFNSSYFRYSLRD